MLLRAATFVGRGDPEVLPPLPRERSDPATPNHRQTGPNFGLGSEDGEGGDEMSEATPVSYYQDDSVTVYHGDALDIARQLPDASVDCIVTSPP